MRKPVIAGNWKMHYTLPEAVKVTTELLPLVEALPGSRKVRWSLDVDPQELF